MIHLVKFNESKKLIHTISREDMEDYLLELLDIGYNVNFFKENYYSDTYDLLGSADEIDNTKYDEWDTNIPFRRKQIKYAGYSFELSEEKKKRKWNTVVGNNFNRGDIGSHSLSLNELKTRFNETQKQFSIIESCLKRLESMVGEVQITVTQFTIFGLGQFSVDIIHTKI